MQSLKFRLRLALAAVGLVAALPAGAQFQKPEDAIKYRQSAMFVMAQHFGRVGAMASGKVPFDAAAAQANTEVVLAMSKLPFVAFSEGTDKGGNTKAKPDIWTKKADFDSKSKTMQDEIVKLAAAAKTGNLDQIKAAFDGAGKSCKSCHDDYREKQN
jgi:cytochrome c556